MNETKKELGIGEQTSILVQKIEPGIFGPDGRIAHKYFRTAIFNRKIKASRLNDLYMNIVYEIINTYKLQFKRIKIECELAELDEYDIVMQLSRVFVQSPKEERAERKKLEKSKKLTVRITVYEPNCETPQI